MSFKQRSSYKKLCDDFKVKLILSNIEITESHIASFDKEYLKSFPLRENNFDRKKKDFINFITTEIYITINKTTINK